VHGAYALDARAGARAHGGNIVAARSKRGENNVARHKTQRELRGMARVPRHNLAQLSRRHLAAHSPCSIFK